MSESFVITSAVWRMASALPIVALGVWSLRGGAARPRGAFAFGLFAIAWGLQIALGNLVTLTTSPAVAGATYLLFVAALGATCYFLVEFAASQALRGDSRRAWRAARGLAMGAAFGTGFLIAFLPQAFIGSLGVASDGRVALTRGPLVDPLMLLVFGAFTLALVALDRAWRAAPTPRAGLPTGMMLGGLAISLGFTSSYYATAYGIDVLTTGSTRWLAFTVTFLLIAALIVRIAARAWALRARAPTRSERLRTTLMAGALLVSLVAGVAEGLLNYGPLPLFSTLGLWRIVGIGVIAYGLARWRLPDLPQRATRVAAAGAGATAAAATGVAAYGAATLLTTSPGLAVLTGAATVSAAFLPGLRLAKRIFARASDRAWRGDDDSLYGARMDAYRAALEAALARNSLEEDEEFLAALRERFSITESEDRLLRHYARACVLAPREGDASAAFERLRLLGEGGAGRTWLARDRVRDRLVVLKEPLERWQREPGMREMVLREARLAARVRHANVIRVEEVLEHRGSPIIVMEFAEGGSLAEMLRRRGVLPWREAVELLVPILRGVEAIHAHGIVHRDLKPSNVLLTLEGEPRIADFGIATAARASDPARCERTVVQGTTFVGTYAYVAPEVRAGAPADRRSDVYACAAMLHEALYGSPPGLQAPVLVENDVPDALGRLLARALADDPATRPGSARSLAEELTSLIVRAQVP